MNSDDTFLLRLAELTAGGEAGLRDLIAEQLAFARNNVVELPRVTEDHTIPSCSVERAPDCCLGFQLVHPGRRPTRPG